MDCTNFASQCLIAGGLILLDEALDYKDWLGKKFLKQPTFTLADALAKYLVEEKKYAVSDNVKDKNVEEKIKAIAEKMKPGDFIKYDEHFALYLGMEEKDGKSRPKIAQHSTDDIKVLEDNVLKNVEELIRLKG